MFPCLVCRYVVMKGYHENPEATRESITEDGWMKTGDLAVIDAEIRDAA